MEPNIEEVRALISDLGREKGEVHSSPVAKLIYEGRHSSAAMSLLIEALKDPDAKVRYKIVHILRKIEIASEPVVQALTLTLTDSDYDVKRRAIYTLAFLGQSPEPVIHTLLQDLNTEDMLVRPGAAEALGYAGVTSAEVISALCESLKDEDYISFNAAKSLGRLGSLSKPIVGKLRGMLKDKNYKVREGAVEAWCRLKPKPPDLIEGLRGMLATEDTYVLELVEYWLRKLEAE